MVKLLNGGQMSKVFGIGLGRTGSASLTQALQILNYNAFHAYKEIHIHQYEAVTHSPVSARYQIIDKMYPGSKFIALIRDLDSWLDTSEIFLTHRDLTKLDDKDVMIELAFCRGVLYGTLKFDRDLFRDAYYRYYDGIRMYFSNRKSDLLFLNICAGEGWEKLCSFLERPVPAEPFPWLRKNKDVVGKPIY